MGNAEHRVVDARSFQSAVAEDRPGLHACEGVLDASTDTAVRGVVLLLSCRKLLAWNTPVRDDQPGAAVAAVSDGGDPADHRLCA